MRIEFDIDLPGTCEIVVVSLFLNNLLGDNYHQSFSLFSPSIHPSVCPVVLRCTLYVCSLPCARGPSFQAHLILLLVRAVVMYLSYPLLIRAESTSKLVAID